jgi:glycosyltransferase involved in cell wall biosynthesis
MNSPLVSVVMSVRNGGLTLLDTINSVLEQKDIDFEFIIVDDGSTDNTYSVLYKISTNDSRVKVMQAKPRGLTISLIEGCQQARGKFIARQDAYDYSQINRLRLQSLALESNSQASICSSYVRFITKERVELFIQKSNESEQREGLSGFIHGSIMFRRDDYLKVGGYRRQFYYAQDVDLWTRLVEVGQHVAIPEVLYENCIYPGSISSSRRREQLYLHSLISGASKERKTGGDENKWLTKAEIYSQQFKAQTHQVGNTSDGAYFIASCLAKSHPSLAKKYFKMSLKSNPFNLRARLKVLSLR